MTMYELENDVRQEVRDRAIELLESRYSSYILNEIADSNVPIYNREKVECLLDDFSLAEVEDEGLISGVTNVFDILGVSIYERLLYIAHDEYGEIESTYETCGECGKWFDTDDSDVWNDEEQMCHDCVERLNDEEDYEDDSDEEEGEKDNW